MVIDNKKGIINTGRNSKNACTASIVQPPVYHRQSVEDIRQLNTSRNLMEQSFIYLDPDDLNMFYCGKQINVYNHRYGPAIRDHFVLVYINDGHGILETNGEKYELNSNYLLTMFPDNKIFYEVDKGTPWSIHWLGLYGRLLPVYLESLGITPSAPICTVTNPDEIINILEILYRRSSGDSLSTRIDCISLLYRFFSCLAENSAGRSDNNKDSTVSPGHSRLKNDYIEHALNYMKYNYEQGISSNDVACNIKLDRRYFSKIFRGVTGVSPTQWLINLRIARAGKLLRETSLTVSEVAYSVGVFDQFYFSRLFKSETGCSPLEYRKKQ